jgi:phosphate transport system substrate-binding protein
MNKSNFGIVKVILWLAVATLGGLARADELAIPGSGNPEFVLRLLANAFNAHQTRHHVTVPDSTGTAGALRDVESGASVLGRVGRPLKADEMARGLAYVSLGRDPVAFVGGAGVTAKGLTQAQVMAAFTGKVSNWSELGGKPASLRVIGRESTDASRQAINRGIKPFETVAFGESVKLVHLDPQMIDLLDRFPGSLGFLNRSALAACKTKVVLLALDGVEPSPQNVGVGRYPLSLEFGLIHKTGSLSAPARAFVDFVKSSEGIRILRDNGVLAAAASR